MRIYRRLIPYAVAIATTGMALLLTLWIEPFLPPIIGAFFYLAVVVSSWYGGLRPGIVATILSMLAISYFFVPPIHSLVITDVSDILQLVVFGVVALIISLLNEDLRVNKCRVEQLSQQLLQESSEQLGMALTAARMGMWDWNLLTGEITWSPEHEQLFGLAPGSFDGRYATFHQRLHPADRDELTQVIERSRQNRNTYQHEFRVIWRDGSIHWIEGRGRFFYDETGQPVRIMGTVMDIDDRKQAEAKLQQTKTELEQRVAERTAALTQINTQLEAELAKRQEIEAILKQSNDEIQDLYNNAPCGYHSLDNEGKVIRMNNTELEWLGYSRNEIIGKQFTDLLTVNSLSVFQTNFSKFKQQGWIKNLEFNLKCKHGSVLPVSMSATAIKDVSGNFIMSRSIVVDNRERMRMEAERIQIEFALRDSETKFRSLSESSPIGIFLTNAQGDTIYTNPRAQEICGYTFEEALGKGWVRFVHPDDLHQLLNQWATDIVEQIGKVYDEIRYVHQDGTIRYGRVQMVPIFGANGNLSSYMGTIEDITARREIDQMKNEFISIVSHELRTPLTAIRGSLGLLAAGVYDNKPEKGKRMLQVASEQSDRLVRLINDILDLQRLESGKIKLMLQKCDAATLMQQSAETMRTSAETSQVQLIVTPLHVNVWAAPDSIIQTLTNLLSNAIKFSPPDGKIWLSAEVRSDRDRNIQSPENMDRPTQDHKNPSSPSPPPSYVLFSVKDQGRGIPSDKLETIFERFQQVNTSDSRDKGGTGLGLTICRKIIEQHHETIWAESLIGEGSTFYFTLPLAEE
jgi:PAS domain S-box-containing protein